MPVGPCREARNNLYYPVVSTILHLHVPSLLVAGVAQLVEQGFCKPQVRGSNPCAGTMPPTKGLA